MSDYIPKKLNFCYFTMDKGYTCVQLENNKLIINKSEKYYIPTHGEWSNFKDKLDEIGVWDWDGDYERCCLIDGYSWELEIEYTNCYIKNEGINYGPHRVVGENVLDSLQELIMAIEELTGFEF